MWHPRWIAVAYIDPILEGIRPLIHGTVLDVGCGSRPHESRLARDATRYVGIDRPGPGPARPDVVGDAMALPVRSRAADAVLATELLEHLPRPADFLAEAARVLRPGGTLVLSTPFLEPLHEEPRDFFRFTTHGLRVLLVESGFEVRSIQRKGGWWSVVVGSFVNQALYDLANPERGDGRRRDNPVLIALVLPLCALAQVVGYSLDRLWPGRRYTLGYVTVATLAHSVPAVGGTQVGDSLPRVPSPGPA